MRFELNLKWSTEGRDGGKSHKSLQHVTEAGDRENGVGSGLVCIC